MSPEAGTEVTLVPPTAPADAVEADNAVAGQVEEVTREAQEKPKPTFKPVKLKDPEEKKLTWIEIEMVDEEGKGVPGVSYEVELPDGSVAGGTLDGNGFARVEGFEEGGDCKISFPRLDKEAWEEA